jgi:hypothetical protein
MQNTNSTPIIIKVATEKAVRQTVEQTTSSNEDEFSKKIWALERHLINKFSEISPEFRLRFENNEISLLTNGIGGTYLFLFEDSILDTMNEQDFSNIKIIPGVTLPTYGNKKQYSYAIKIMEVGEQTLEEV